MLKQFEIVKKTYTDLTTEFVIKKQEEFIKIDHNPDNLFAIHEISRGVNPTLCFFVGLLNAFQSLPMKTEEEQEMKYHSYSQSLTTYLLKLLSRRNIIEITNYRKGTKFNINALKNILEEEYNQHFTQMYTVEFIKKRDLTIEDLDFLKSIARILKVSMPQVKQLHNKLGFAIPDSEKNSRLAWIKNIWDQRECYQHVFEIIERAYRGNQEELIYGQSALKRTKVK